MFILEKAIKGGILNTISRALVAPESPSTPSSNQVSFRPKTSDIITYIGSIGAGRVGVPDNAVNIEELQKSRKLG